MQKRLERLPRWLSMLIGVLLTALIGYIDFLTGDYSVLTFYAIPVAFVAWTVGRRGALAISVASGVTRFISDSISYSGTGVRYWNSLQDMLFLLMMGLLVAQVRKLIIEDHQKKDR